MTRVVPAARSVTAGPPASETEGTQPSSPISSAVRASERDAFLALEPDEMADSVRRGVQAHLGTMERLRLILVLGRPRTCVPGLIAYGLGYSYTGAPPSWRTALGALLALSIGFSANLHNTATDLAEDSRNLPGRVFRVSRLGYASLMSVCKWLGVGMLAGGAALGWHFAAFMTLAVLGLHQYSAPPLRSKGRPVLGIWVFAQAVAFPYLFGWTTAPGAMLSTLVRSFAAPWTGASPPPDAAHRSLRYLGMWAFLTLWFMAKGTFKNVPDYEGDKAAGVRTSATIFSSRRTAALVATFATCFAYSGLALLVVLGLEKPRVLLSLTWLAPAAWNCLRLMGARNTVDSNRILKADMFVSSGFIASILLLLAPTRLSVVLALCGAALLFASDFLGLDSRSSSDVARERPAA